jgi:hypothetical protein
MVRPNKPNTFHYPSFLSFLSEVQLKYLTRFDTTRYFTLQYLRYISAHIEIISRGGGANTI